MNKKNLSLLFILATVFSTVLTSQSVSDSGAFTYSYPIEIPDGTNGMQPSLSLEYNSQRGNGMLGMGWSLSGLQSITRDTTYPVKWDEEKDHFLLNGQRLIPDSSTSGLFRTEYESFLKIEFLSSGTSSSHWVVTRKDGTKLFFGDTTDSRIEAVGHGTQARIWSLNKVLDVHGNYYEVEYEEDPSGGDYYPAKITYTKGNGLSAFHTVEFSYEERPDHWVKYNPSKVDRDQRLEGLIVKTNESLVWKYKIDYDSLQNKVQLYSRLTDITRLSENGIPFPEKTISLNYNDFSSLSYEGWSGATNGLLNRDGMDNVYFVDVNGDGKQDLVAIPPANRSNSGVVYVALSNGTNFQEGWSGASALLDKDVMDNVYFVDVNGDGKQDLVSIPPANRSNSGVVYVALSNGTSFQEGWSGASALLDKDVMDNVHFADVNGDGKQDLVAIPPANRSNSGVVYVALSNGTSFQEGWSGASALLDKDVMDNVHFADVNGDGKQDLVAIPPANRSNSGVVYVALSNGTSFQEGWSGATSGLLNTDVMDNVYFVDVNGDGKQDLVAIPPANRSNSGVVYIALSNGISFQEGWSRASALLDKDVMDNSILRM